MILCDQCRVGNFARRRLADDFHEIIQIVDGNFVAFKNVKPLFRFFQTEPRASGNHIAPMLQVAFEKLQNVHLLRALLIQCQKDDTEGGFQRREFVKFV